MPAHGQLMAVAVDVPGLPVVMGDLEGLAGAGVAREVHELVGALAALDLLVVVMVRDRLPGLAL
jgi:hypothetical protein